MNAAWHDANKMPTHATTAQRLAWHQAHQKACGCRPIPAGLLAATAKPDVTVKKPKAKRTPSS